MTADRLIAALKWWLEDPNEVVDYNAWVDEGIAMARAALDSQAPAEGASLLGKLSELKTQMTTYPWSSGSALLLLDEIISSLNGPRRVSDEEVRAWVERHDFGASLSLGDYRAMVEDARTIELAADAPNVQPKSTERPEVTEHTVGLWNQRFQHKYSPAEIQAFAAGVEVGRQKEKTEVLMDKVFAALDQQDATQAPAPGYALLPLIATQEMQDAGRAALAGGGVPLAKVWRVMAEVAAQAPAVGAALPGKLSALKQQMTAYPWSSGSALLLLDEIIASLSAPRRVSDDEIRAWVERHDFSASLSLGDYRAMVEDARTIELAPAASHVPVQGSQS